jgi:HEPN domain-containing protein
MSFTIKQHVDHWISSSNESVKDMNAALKSNRRLNAVYCGHQSIEKIFKALLASKNIQIVYTHKTAKLASLCGLGLTQKQIDELDAIDQFYIASKYASAKSKLYALCTPQYTKQWIDIIRNWHRHIKQQVITERASLPNNIPAMYPENLY